MPRKKKSESFIQNQESATAATSMGTPQFNPPEARYESSRKGGAFLGASIVILLLALAGAGYAYYAGFFTSPEKMIKDSFANAGMAQSATYDVTLTVDTSKVNPDSGFDISPVVGDTKVLRLTSKGSYATSGSATKATGDLEFGGGTFSAALDFRYLNQMLYIKLTKTPAALDMFDIASLKNKWISFSVDEEMNTQGSPLALAGVDGSLIEDLTDEQKKHLYEMTNNADLFSVTEKLAPETVGGAISYHYVFDLNKEGIARYLSDLTAYLKEVGKDNSKLASFDATDMTERLDTIQNFKGEIWIGKNDTLPHKIVMAFDAGNPEEPDNGTIGITVAGIFSNWNKAVTIEAPEGSMSLEELMGQMMGM